MRINNRTDFELVLSLKDNATQKTIPLPISRFKIELYTREAVSFAKRITIYSDDPNAKRSDDGLHLKVAVHVDDSLYLPNGTLMARFYFDEANAEYPDGVRHTQRPIDTGVIIWGGDSDLPSSVNVEMLTSYFKGDTGQSAYELYMQLHPDSTLSASQYATTPIKAAEQVTINLELISELEGVLRVNEAARVRAEARRDVSELERQNSESTRESSEQARRSSEHIRLRNETERNTVDGERTHAEAIRIFDENTRTINEHNRVKSEAERDDSETARVETEAMRATAEQNRQTNTASAIELTNSATSAATSAAALANESAQIVETIEGASVVIDVVGGRTYICGELTSLNVKTVADSPRDSFIRFRSGAVVTTLALPANLKVVGYAKPAQNMTYEIAIANRVAYIICV